MGRRRVQQFFVNARSTVVSACARDVRRLAEAVPEQDIRLVAHPEDVYNDPDVAAVAISVPNTLHYAHAKQALLAGKHVLCEYPLTNSLAQYDELVGLARSRGLILHHSLTPRAESLHRTMREALQGLGEPRAAYYRYYGGAGWYVQPELRGDMFCALHVQNALLAAEAGAAVDWAAVGAVAAVGCALSAGLDARTGDALRDLCDAARMCAQIAGGEALETSSCSEAALEIALRHTVCVASVAWPSAAGVLVRELARRASQRPDTASVARLAVLVRGAVASAQAASEEGTACMGNLIEALGDAAEAVKRCGAVYPPAETAWLCATAHNAALALVSAPGQCADALRHAAALGGHAVALAAAMADGPLRRGYEPAVRGLHARLLVMAADSGP